ncbi:hypothetical protein HanIR_Chr02g0062481 [Helianthus annuus]|nr:hypothetical protein HanIR_Chr02g0062481 [Helianthus annuus]
MLLGGCCDVSCSLLGFTQSNKLRHSWCNRTFLLLELHWCIRVGQFLLLLNSRSHMTQHLKWVFVFLQPVSNCVWVKMGSVKNHFKWVRVKTGWLRKGFLFWLLVAAVVSSCQLLWWHQHRLVSDPPCSSMIVVLWWRYILRFPV